MYRATLGQVPLFSSNLWWPLISVTVVPEEILFRGLRSGHYELHNMDSLTSQLCSMQVNHSLSKNLIIKLYGKGKNAVLSLNSFYSVRHATSLFESFWDKEEYSGHWANSRGYGFFHVVLIMFCLPFSPML